MRKQKNITTMNIKKSCLLFIAALLPAASFAFDVYVKDAYTRLPIPYALVSSHKRTAITDISGQLTLSDSVVHISAFGYRTINIELEGSDSTNVYLKPLQEYAVLPDDEQAREIIMRMGDNHIAPPPHRVWAHSRTVGYKRIKKAKGPVLQLESLSDTLHNWYYTYSSEVISQRTVTANGSLQETIVESRQDGYRWHSQFALLVNQFSTDLWRSPIVMDKVRFLNPFYRQQSHRYRYAIVDTLQNEEGTQLLRIGFAPRKASRDMLLEGEIVVEMQGLQPVCIAMRPSLREDGSASFTVWQRYSTTQLGCRQAVEQAMLRNIGLGGLNTRLFTISELSNFTPAKEVSAPAPTPTLHALSPTSLPERTMRKVYALSQHKDLDAIPHKIDSYFSFRYPLKYVNIPIFSLIDYNPIEGPRVGLAIETSDRLSAFFQLEGHYAYGIMDKKHKYGGFLRLNMLPRYAMQLQFGYKHDVVMPGDIIRTERGGRYLLGDYLYNASAPTLDYRDDYRVTLSGRVHRGLSLFVEGAYSHYQNTPSMGFRVNSPDGGVTASTAPYATVSGKIEARWVPLQRLVSYAGEATVVEEKEPLVRAIYTIASDAHRLDRPYHKLEGSLFAYDASPLWGSYMLSLRGGISLGDFPMADGYFNSGTGGDAFGVSFEQTFFTVPIGFAYRDYYVEMQALYDFYPLIGLKLLDSWELSPVVTFNAGWGGVSHSYTWKTPTPPVDMGKGLFEVGCGIAGLIPNSIYPPLRPSVNGYYRLGAYADSDPMKNWAITINLLLGL